MSISVRPKSPGWELIKNTRNLVIYAAPEIGLTLFLTKHKGIWTIEWTDREASGEVDEVSKKDIAIARAKKFMYDNPVLPEMVPVIQPGEELKLRAGKFKRPGRVTQFSRYKR